MHCVTACASVRIVALYDIFFRGTRNRTTIGRLLSRTIEGRFSAKSSLRQNRWVLVSVVDALLQKMIFVFVQIRADVKIVSPKIRELSFKSAVKKAPPGLGDRNL
ncbi:unnamed protein product [Soboliphyme baturini]|uniref:Secreted protein n=1 Tax=Soboliphyme baturini TaxID=241478 RepID=A0A183IBZ6_9BILA|nr:unnamed protein product [Soboliphyme baturini]